jgi:hypothetical protein
VISACHRECALFSELASELNCVDHPRLFPSDHSRFTYFRRPAAPQAVLDRLVARLDVPDATEAHQVEWAPSA